MVFGLSNNPIEALKKGLPKKEGSSPMQSVVPMQSVNPTPLKKVIPTQSYGGFEGITKPLGQTAINPSGFGQETVATNFPTNVQQQIGTQVAQSTTQPIQQAGNTSTAQGSLGSTDINKALTELQADVKAGMPVEAMKEYYPEINEQTQTELYNDIKAGMPIEEATKFYPELTAGQTQEQQPRTIGGKTVDELHGTGPIGGITRTLQEAIVDIPNWAGNLLSYGDKISGVLDRGIDSIFGTNLAEQATKFDEKTKVMGLEPNVGAYGPKTTDYLQNKLGVDKEATSTMIGNFVSEMIPFLIPGAGGLEAVNFATKLEKAPGIIKIAKESPNLYKFVLKPVLKTVAKDLPQAVLGAQEYAMMSRAENTNPTEIATALAMTKILNGIIATPGAMKWIGKELYGLNVRPSTQEAKAIQSFEAGLSSKAPRTTVDTALETGSPTSLVGRRSGIGTDAEREANKIFEKEINPIVQSIDEGGFTKKVDDIGVGAKKRIDNQNISDIEKAKSKEVVDEIIEDMKQYGGDEMNLQQIGKNKSALDSIVSKKAQEKGYSPKVEQNAKLMVADEMRNIQHTTISKTAGIDSATKFKDWYNLSELSKIGIKARTEGTMPVPTGGSFVGMRAIFDTLLTPITSTAGKFLYRVGKFLTIEGPKGLGGQTLGSIIKNNGGKIDQDGFLALPSPETVSKSNLGTPQNPIVSKGLPKKDILEINNLKNGVANSNNSNLLSPSKQVATDLNKVNTNPKPEKTQGGGLTPKQEPKPIKQEKNTLGTPLNKTVKAKPVVEPLPNKNNPLVKNKIESKAKEAVQEKPVVGEKTLTDNPTKDLKGKDFNDYLDQIGEYQTIIKEVESKGYEGKLEAYKQYEALARKTLSSEIKNNAIDRMKGIAQSFFDSRGYISKGGQYNPYTPELLKTLPEYAQTYYKNKFLGAKEGLAPKKIETYAERFEMQKDKDQAVIDKYNEESAGLAVKESKGLKPNNISVRKPTVMMKTPTDLSKLSIDELQQGLKDGGPYNSAIEVLRSPYKQEIMRRATSKQGLVTKTSNNLYHTTSASNLDSIMKEGLTPGKAQRFEGVGSKSKLSFGANEKTAEYYGKDGDVMIRTKASYKPKTLEEDLLAGGKGAYTVSESIPANMLEVKKGGKWVSLDEYKAPKPLEAKVSNPVVTMKEPLIQEAKKYEGKLKDIYGKAKDTDYVILQHNTKQGNIDKILKEGLNPSKGVSEGPGMLRATIDQAKKPYTELPYGGNEVYFRVRKVDAEKMKVNSDQFNIVNKINPEDIVAVNKTVKLDDGIGENGIITETKAIDRANDIINRYGKDKLKEVYPKLNKFWEEANKSKGLPMKK